MTETNYSACSIQGCTRKHKAKGYCLVHYKTYRRRELKNGAQPAQVTLRKAVQCQYCGASYKPKATDRTTFCSRQCSFDAKYAPKYSVVYAGFCNGCGKAFVSRRKRLYCCDACVPRPIYISIAPNEKTCASCGKRYAPVGTGGRPSEYCSAMCRDVVGRAAKRIDKAKRHALKRGATTERVDPFVVFNRDKWKCKLCGCKAPRSKRGTYDDDAPELDHIQPLSKGGEHSYRNTQCLCRKCNGLKSDTPKGQLLMFG